MTKVFKETDIELTNPVVLTVVPETKPIIVVVGLLAWLENNGAIITNKGWNPEKEIYSIGSGIEVKFEKVTFHISCTNKQVHFKRLAGDKANFWGLCKLFHDTDL